MPAPHIPQRFDETNTEGYSHAELDELNRRFDKEIDKEHHLRWQDDELTYKSWTDHVAERVLAKFDAERAA